MDVEALTQELQWDYFAVWETKLNESLLTSHKIEKNMGKSYIWCIVKNDKILKFCYKFL